MSPGAAGIRVGVGVGDNDGVITADGVGVGVLVAVGVRVGVLVFGVGNGKPWACMLPDVSANRSTPTTPTRAIASAPLVEQIEEPVARATGLVGRSHLGIEAVKGGHRRE